MRLRSLVTRSTTGRSLSFTGRHILTAAHVIQTAVATGLGLKYGSHLSGSFTSTTRITPCRTPRRQGRLDRLVHLLAVLHALDLPPAAPLARPLRQTDPLLAVEGRPAPAALLSGPHRLGQRPQSGILAQAADHREAVSPGPFQEGAFGVGAIDDHPEPLEVRARLGFQPGELIDGHLRLGAEWPWPFGGSLGRSILRT